MCGYVFTMIIFSRFHLKKRKKEKRRDINFEKFWKIENSTILNFPRVRLDEIIRKKIEHNGSRK